MIKGIYLSIVLGVLVFSCSAPTENDSTQTATDDVEHQAATDNDLPALQIILLDGKSVPAKELRGNVVLILFQPDCDHCQHEARAIEEKLTAFSSYELYFLSSAPPGEIEKFSKDYKLDGRDNVHFGMVEFQPVIDNFGQIPAPSIYIYADGKLLNKFNGQTDVNQILETL